MGKDFVSILPVLSADPELVVALRNVVEPLGWRCIVHQRIETLVAPDQVSESAALVADCSTYNCGDVLAAVRALGAPANGTPVVTLGGDGTPAGPARHLPLPLDPQAFTEMLAEWVGPLEDHAARAMPPSPRFRLIRLVGHAAAEGMLARFRAEIEAASAGFAADPVTVPAHRLAGVAGLIGYADLAALWATADKGNADDVARAIAASRGALGLAG